MLSFWEKKSFLNYDVIIVGAGITGLSTAISLKETYPNLEILVLERGLFPTGASTKNAGFACFGSLTELLSDIEQMGEEKMTALVESRWKGLLKLRSRLGDAQIDFKQHGGFELLESNFECYQDHLAQMNKLLRPIFNKDVFRDATSSLGDFGFLGFDSMILNGLEGQIDTGKMMKSLWELGQSLGIKILTGANAVAIEPGESGQITLENGTKLKASVVALCTNAFTNALLTEEADLQPGRGLVLSIKPSNPLKFQGTFHVEEGYYYFRNHEDHLIFGGGRNLDFESEATTDFDINQKIRDHLIHMITAQILPHQKFEIVDEWTGIMAFGETKEPIIKKVNQNTYMGVRLGGMGVAIGSLVGEQLAALVSESF